MKSILNIGGFHIYLLGITIMLGLLVGYAVASKEAKRKGIGSDKFIDLAITVIAGAILGARLYFVLAFQPAYYLENPLEILAVRSGGLSIQGGLLGGAIAGALFLKMKRLPFWPTFDAIAVALPLGQFIGRIGCDVFGIPMSKPYIWGIITQYGLLHPVQIYEAILDLFLFGLLWQMRSIQKFNGQLAALYIIGFGFIRGTIEFFRYNPPAFRGFTTAHITSLAMIVIGTALYFALRSTGKTPVRKPVKQPHILFGPGLLVLAIIGTAIFYTIQA